MTECATAAHSIGLMFEHRLGRRYFHRWDQRIAYRSPFWARCVAQDALSQHDYARLSTIKHDFTTLHSLTSEDYATFPKATKVRRIVTGQASGLTMQPTAGARQDDQSHCNSNRPGPNQGVQGPWQAWSIRSGSENRHLRRSQVASPATDPGLPD